MTNAVVDLVLALADVFQNFVLSCCLEVSPLKQLAQADGV